MCLWGTQFSMDMKEIIAKAGGCSRLASGLGLKSHATVLRWKKVPDKYLVRIEATFGIPREELRPDLFAKPETTGVAA